MNIHEITKFFDRGEVFHFARYTFEIWQFLLTPIQTKDEDEFQYALSRTVKEQRSYLYGMCDRAAEELKQEISEYLIGTFIPWIDADIFRKGCSVGMMGCFFAALQSRKVCFVGPTHLHNLPPEIFNKEKHKIRSCIAGTHDGVIELLYEAASEFEVILFCRDAFLAPLYIHRLHPSFRSKTWLIDIGTVLDPFCATGNPLHTIDIANEQAGITKELLKANLICKTLKT